MKNIIEFCKNKYKILIPVMVVFVLLVALLFYYKEYKYDSYRNHEEVDVYQYFGGIRTDYKAMISYNIKKIIVEDGIKVIEENNYVSKGDIIISSDIYLNDELKDQKDALGKVYAEVWYKVKVSLPLYYYDEIITGHKINTLKIKSTKSDIMKLKTKALII